MTLAAVVLAAALAPGSTLPPDSPDADVLARAEADFAEGTTHRNDADAARPRFRSAARGYDELWRRGRHAPALALTRARAHRLAGDLPASIAAFHDGLAVAPYDRPLQVGLEDARSAVTYPLVGDLVAECRPKPAGGISSRMSPAEAYLAAGLLWLLACLGMARFAMTRAPASLAFVAVALVGLGTLAGFWWQDWRRQTRVESRPLVIVTADATLRRGNGDSYPPRLETKLPRGVEARVLTRRGGWVQVELAGGAVGWLPGATIQ
jgi:hypothetical protein